MGSKRNLVLLAIAIIAIVAYFQSQNNVDVVTRLQAEGFRVDHSMQSIPPVVVDLRGRQLALIYSDRAVRIDFDQVLTVEEKMVIQGDRSEPLEIRMKLQNHLLPSITLRAHREGDSQKWRKQLQGWLADR